MLESIKTSNYTKLDDCLAEQISKNKTNNALFLLAKDGQIKFLEKYGWLNKEQQIPLEFDSIFRLYSMSKPITAVGLMLLVEKGLVNLNDRITDFLPEFKETEVLVKEENGKLITEKKKREITVLDLLTHRSGLSYQFFPKDPIDRRYIQRMQEETAKGLDLENATKLLASIPLRFQPGKYFHYSFSYDVLGRIIEVVSDQPFQKYLEQKVFKPLEMKDTAFYVPAEKMDKFVTLYSTMPDKKIIPLTGPDYTLKFTKHNPLKMGGSGLVSTITDYYNFSKMLLNKGSFNGKSLLKKETIELMTKNQIKDNKTFTAVALRPDFWQRTIGYGYGLGFRIKIDENQFTTPLGEYGWSGMAMTYFWIDPINSVIGILLSQIFTNQINEVELPEIIKSSYVGLNLKT